jgi:hypothetical protein
LSPGAVLRRALAGIGRVLAALPPGAVLGIAWAILLLYAFPGVMTQDSFDHVREMRAGIYSDAHPPIINVLWKLCEYVVAGPFGVLVFQSGLLLAGLYAILRRSFEPRPAAWWTAAVFVSPPVLAVMAVIWKDCCMAALLAVAIAGLLSGRRAARLGALVAIVLAAAFRYNAFGATLPLVVLLFEWRPGMHWLRRYALSTAVWLATTFAAFGIDAALTDKPMHYWHSSLAIYDIVGTLANVEGTMSDDALKAELRGTDLQVDHDLHARIRAAYTPRDFFPILNDPANTLWSLPINGYDPAPEAQRDAIERAWWQTIESHPWAYLKHRLAVMAEALDLRTTRALGAVARREYRDPGVANQLGLSTGWSTTQRKLTRALQWISRHSPLFVPWVYLVLTLVLLPLAWRQRDVLAILLSGLGLEATLLPLVHSRDYRYSHWMVITTLIGCIVVVARRYRAARRRLLLVGDEAGVPAAGRSLHEPALHAGMVE